MIPLRIVSRARLAPSSLPSRLSAARHARPFTSPTVSRSRPSAQLAEIENDSPEPYYHHRPSSSSEPSPLSPYPLRAAPPIQLPSPLPSDVIPEATAAQSSLYPSTGVIDSISMISICLRRPEHVPRAYQIFKQLLEDSRTGVRTLPDAEVWGRVIEGVAALGRKGQGEALVYQNWRQRAQRLVSWWETSCGVEEQQGIAAGLERGGYQVYQGWLAGMVHSQSPLTPLAPYFANETLSVDRLLSAIEPSTMPLAYESLLELARNHGLQRVNEAVRKHQGVERERRELLQREVVEEVKPVLETTSKSSRTRTAAPTEGEPSSEHPQARFAVSNLRKTLSHLNSASLPRNRQHDLERASYDAARAELAHSAKLLEDQKITAVAEAQTLQREQLQAWMYTWLGDLSAKLRKDMETMRQRQDAVSPGDRKEGAQVYTASTGLKEGAVLLYMSLLPVDKLALITILEIMRMSGTGGIADGMKALRGMLAVGKAVETEYRAETIKNVAGVDSTHWLRAIDPQTQKPSRALVSSVWHSLGRQLKEGKEGADEAERQLEQDLRAFWTPAWSQMVQLGLGSYLVESLLSVAKVKRFGRDPVTGEQVTEEQAAFTHGYDYVRGKKLGVIRLNPVVASRLARDNVGVVIHPKHLPMLVEPRPWRSHDEGGYLMHRVPIMRFKESLEQQTYLSKASEAGHLEPVFHGLDVLSSTPWAINRKVFDIVLKAWNSGEAIADIPASEDKANYKLPPKPDARDTDPSKRSQYVESVKQVLAAQRKDHSERCKFNYNLEIARSYLNDTFYLPHNMDFRGRAYPIPPHLSPVGDDLCRGLLTFGVKKPVGKTGLKWLQIHLANVYGFDKASFEERARFAQDHEQDIFDSADRPLEGNRWWLQAEDPWQCLATCFELAAALRSPDPTAFESSLPVHQDGTCNGMQHYAALGGDVRGAKAVNLENGDRPADIYSGVADIVNKVIADDRASGHPVAQLIHQPLGRKVVKQTVMTTVYGVTFIGARDQIAKQLIARGDIPSEHVFTVSAYVAKTVLGCIGDLFSGAKDIMEWLTTAARLISRSIPPERVTVAAQHFSQKSRGPKAGKSSTRIAKELMTSVIWTTPLGLPVVQPYRKAAKKQVMTALQTVYISDPNAPAEVSPQKQATAFPPNFIHSLDATHMLLTALRCKQANITFASVHDSYWTHASSVEDMSERIRETFIHLHSQDLVGELRQEFLERYGEHRIPVRNAKQISNSTTKRRAKDEERRQRLAHLMADELEHPTPSTSSDRSPAATGENPAVEALEDATAHEASLDDALAPHEIGSEGIEADEPELELSGPSGPSGSSGSLGSASTTTGSEVESESDFVSESESGAKSDALGLSSDDLANLASRKAKVVLPEERIENQRFVKFADVLPPCPPRGGFDVNRIRDSAYFFS